MRNQGTWRLVAGLHETTLMKSQTQTTEPQCNRVSIADLFTHSFTHECRLLLSAIHPHSQTTGSYNPSKLFALHTVEYKAVSKHVGS